ncbi:hypothetical protein AB0D37_43220 [Streptomyces sp. NPDC048384]|uniref:hypothetical protein n=1 Tax=Streptomyces sp. NPDC048384 TaxID=3155487 RepID=UPI00343C21FA
MFAKLSANRRHSRLMNVATALVREAEGILASAPVETVTADRVRVLAFGRHQLRISETEAAEYLAAALVSRGHSTDHLPAVSLPAVSAGSYEKEKS